MDTPEPTRYISGPSSTDDPGNEDSGIAAIVVAALVLTLLLGFAGCAGNAFSASLASWDDGALWGEEPFGDAPETGTIPDSGIDATPEGRPRSQTMDPAQKGKPDMRWTPIR